MTKAFRIPISVLVYCFRRDADGIDYLLLRRTPTYGSFWQGVTGAIEGSETPLDGARRELLEETRLSPARLYQVDFECTFALEEEWKWAYAPGIELVKEFVFLAEISDGSDPILSFEHDLYEWMPYMSAISRLKWPNNQRALEFCNHLLTSHSHTKSSR